MDWVFPYGPEEFQVFVEESEEQLQVLEDGLLELERSGISAEQIAAVFRAAHTLKGAAGTVGHQPLLELTHALEGVLDDLRGGRLQFSPAVADALLGALDRLRGLHADIVAGRGGTQDVAASVAALRALAPAGEAAGAEGPQTPAAASAVPVPAPPPTGASAEGKQPGGVPSAAAAAGKAPAAPAPSPAVEKRPAQAAGAGQRWRVEVRLTAECPMPAVRAFQVLSAAGKLGSLAEASPTQAEIEQGRASDRIAFTIGGCEQGSLAAAIRRFPDVADVKVAPVAPKAPPQVQQSVRVDVSLLDRLMNLVGELVVDRTRLSRAAALTTARGEGGREELREVAAHLWRVTAELQDEVMRARLLPVETLFRRYPRLVRDAAHQTGKDIDFQMAGQDTELDRSVLEEIADPLMHLLRNAVDHGIEPAEARRAAGKPARGSVRLEAEHRDNHVVITIADDGAGLDPERLRTAAVERGLMAEDAARRLSDDEAIRLIFTSGFTTREQATALSGRGVGMDVVRRNVERLGGAVRVQTAIGRGSTFTIQLPLTLAIVQALLVRIGTTSLALPLQAIVEVGQATADRIGTLQGHEVARLRERVLPLIRGSRILEGAADLGEVIGRPFVHLQAGDQAVALLVDELLGQQEVVIKGLDRRVGSPPGFTGAAVLADGQLALVVDPVGLVKGGLAVA